MVRRKATLFAWLVLLLFVACFLEVLAFVSSFVLTVVIIIPVWVFFNSQNRQKIINFSVFFCVYCCTFVSSNDTLHLYSISLHLYSISQPGEISRKTAENANIDAVLVTWGFRTREKLIDSGASLLVDKPREIIDIIFS